MTLVEKVARAIAKECYGKAKADAWLAQTASQWDWDKDMDDECKQYCFDYARAAIEAMREPTDGMHEAYRCDDLWRDLDSVKVWQLWIDAALIEEPEK